MFRRDDKPLSTPGTRRQTAQVPGPTLLVFAVLGVLAPAPASAATEDQGLTEAPGEVPDATWSALEGKQVIVETSSGAVEGELTAAAEDTLVVIEADGRVRSVPKRDATGVRVAPRPGPVLPTTPPPETREGEPSQDGAEHGQAAAEQERDTTGQKQGTERSRKEERKEKRRQRARAREHALLGTFTAHGAAYAHWRGDGISAGHAAYTMDWGIGINPTPRFGMYAVGGGLLGARIDDKQVRANYGHLAFMFAFGGKYYFSTFGAGAAFSRLAFENETQKDIGLALPAKIFGKIPLPKKLYIGIGLSYELGLVREFHRVVNGVGGQIVFGRW